MKKEIKTFFDKENRLNKGYQAALNVPLVNNAHFKKKIDHFLPSLDVLQEYEDLYPGTVPKLLNLAEKEQLHRHQQEKDTLISSANRAKLQDKILLFGMMSVLVIALILTNWLSKSIYSAVIADIIIFIMLVFIIFFYKDSKKPLNFGNDRFKPKVKDHYNKVIQNK